MLKFKFPCIYSCVLVALMCLADGKMYNVGDVTVLTEPFNFRCDRISCPPNAHRCVVTKTSTNHHLTIVIRENLCYSISNQLLKRSKTYETVNTAEPINFRLNVEYDYV
ncbi:uncharacterized protein [Musca autumnalis]|uniref:uncharacterized protein n=1 Tax=Musca autumnalis TaxID=221902 RepID=UPI003CEC7387